MAYLCGFLLLESAQKWSTSNKLVTKKLVTKKHLFRCSAALLT
nr:MAG TPA: hypothetical protein [Caudoviricetes sp.]